MNTGRTSYGKSGRHITGVPFITQPTAGGYDELPPARSAYWNTSTRSVKIALTHWPNYTTIDLHSELFSLTKLLSPASVAVERVARSLSYLVEAHRCDQQWRQPA